MKFIKNLSSSLAVTALLFTFSCKSGEKKSDDSASVAETVAEQAALKPNNIMAVTFKVVDYSKWLPGYESHDSIRQHYGLHNFVICRGTRDTSMLMVVLKMDNVDQARAFAELPELKVAMKKGGVIGKPEIRYINVQMMDTTANTASERVLVSHDVQDYDSWKANFDSQVKNRDEGGLRDRTLGYEVGDNKRVVLSFIIDDAARAEAYLESKYLTGKIETGGVDGKPTFFYYSIAKQY